MKDEIFVLQDGQRILCKQCGCHGFGIIAKGYHCSACSPVTGTKVSIKTLGNKHGQVIGRSENYDHYDIRLANGKRVDDVVILEMRIIE